jgi:hypothetical protein
MVQNARYNISMMRHADATDENENMSDVYDVLKTRERICEKILVISLAAGVLAVLFALLVAGIWYEDKYNPVVLVAFAMITLVTTAVGAYSYVSTARVSGTRNDYAMALSLGVFTLIASAGVSGALCSYVYIMS